MVAVFVSSILLVVLFRLFTVSAHIGTEELGRTSTETTALFILRKVEADVQNSSPAGISLSTDNRNLVVHPMDTTVASGQVTYKNELLLWNHDTGNKTLTRWVNTNYFSPFDLRPARLDESAITTLISDTANERSGSFLNISDFTVNNPADVDPPSIGSPLTISVTVEIVGADTRPDVTLTKAVQIRSSGN